MDPSKRALKRPSSSPKNLGKGLKRKETIVDHGRHEARAREAENVLLNMTPKRKGTTKEIDQEARLKRDSSTERQFSRKAGRSPSERGDRPLCCNYKRGNCSHDRECDYLHHPQCNYFRKDNCEMGQDCPYEHPQKKKPSTSTKRTRKNKII